MLKEMLPSLMRYLLAGFTAWAGSELQARGFDPQSSTDLAQAGSAFITAAVLLLWSGKKNKKNAEIKKKIIEEEVRDHEKKRYNR